MVLNVDEIIIERKFEEEHNGHLRKLLNIIREQNIYIIPSKCKFRTMKVDYLG